jgi:hypothetical protein
VTILILLKQQQQQQQQQRSRNWQKKNSHKTVINWGLLREFSSPL